MPSTIKTRTRETVVKDIILNSSVFDHWPELFLLLSKTNKSGVDLALEISEIMGGSSLYVPTKEEIGKVYDLADIYLEVLYSGDKEQALTRCAHKYSRSLKDVKRIFKKVYACDSQNMGGGSLDGEEWLQ